MVIESPICTLSSDAELVSAAHALATDSSNMMASVGTIKQHRNTHTHTIYSTEKIVESVVNKCCKVQVYSVLNTFVL